MGTLHLAVSVFSLIYSLEDFVPPKVEEDYLPFSWSDSKWAHLVHIEEISILNLNSLHPSSKPYLGKPRLGRTVKLVGYGPQLLDDSLG